MHQPPLRHYHLWVVKPSKIVLPISMAIAALLEGTSSTQAGAVAAPDSARGVIHAASAENVRASRLWERRQFLDQWSAVEGHRSHYSHRSSRGSSGGGSWHGNSHSSSHRSHYSSRGSSSSGGGSSGNSSNILKRAAWRVIWGDDDDDGTGGIPDKNMRTSTTSTTSTIPTVAEEQTIEQQWRYETCWFDDGDLGAKVVLQLRNEQSEWKNVKAPTARTVLRRYEQVENSKCTIDRPHSAVTTWLPSGPGVYYLRHYYVGFKGIEGYPYEEIMMLVIR